MGEFIEPASALGALQRARSDRRRARLRVSDILYRTYLGLILGGYAFGYLLLRYSTRAVDPNLLDLVRDYGSVAAAITAAALINAGISSGARGGPTTPSFGDFAITLRAPLPRASVLRPHARRQASQIFPLAALCGAVGAFMLGTALPVDLAGWLGIGAVLGVFVAAVAWGGAMIIAGSGTGRSRARFLKAMMWGLVAALWVAHLDILAADRATLLPVPWPIIAALAVAACIAVTAGLMVVGRTSVEALSQRVHLNSQLRFAVLTRSFREVVLIRRHLAGENPRKTPWFRLRGDSSRAIWRRYWRSIARWPTARVFRFAFLASVAGVGAASYWHGFDLAVVVPVVCLSFAALDAIEPIGQHVDRPDVITRAPRDQDWVLWRFLVAGVVLMALFGVVATLVAFGLLRDSSVLFAAPWLVGLCSVSSISAAVLMVTREPPPLMTATDIANPFGGVEIVLRQLWRPILASAGLIPLVFAKLDNESPHRSFIVGVIAAVLVVSAAVLSIRFYTRLQASVERIRRFLAAPFWRRRG